MRFDGRTVTSGEAARNMASISMPRPYSLFLERGSTAKTLISHPHNTTSYAGYIKTHKSRERNSTTCKCIFHQLAVKNVNVNVVIAIYCQLNWIFLGQNNIISIHYLTDQNQGLSGLKNIWPVMMTGDLLSIIFGPDQQEIDG